MVRSRVGGDALPRAGSSDAHDARVVHGSSCFTWNVAVMYPDGYAPYRPANDQPTSRRAFWIRCVTQGLVEPCRSGGSPPSVVNAASRGAPALEPRLTRGSVPADAVPIHLPTSRKPALPTPRGPGRQGRNVCGVDPRHQEAFVKGLGWPQELCAGGAAGLGWPGSAGSTSLQGCGHRRHIHPSGRPPRSPLSGGRGRRCSSGRGCPCPGRRRHRSPPGQPSRRRRLTGASRQPGDAKQAALPGVGDARLGRRCPRCDGEGLSWPTRSPPFHMKRTGWPLPSCVRDC